MPKQKPIPAAVCSFDCPLAIILKNRPSKNPPKLPTANSSPTAEPSPTGNTSSHPNSNIIGTRGIKKKELKAEMKLASVRFEGKRRG